MAVQWLRLRAFNAGGMGSIPGRGTKIPHATCVCVCLVAQLCLTFCDPVDSGSPVNESFQARILEWVAISSSRGSSQPRARTCIFTWEATCHMAEPKKEKKNTHFCV